MAPVVGLTTAGRIDLARRSDERDPPVKVLDEGRAVLDPVTAVVVVDSVEAPDGPRLDDAATLALRRALRGAAG